MTVYKGCPHCDTVFEIGPDDDWPLRAHLIERHGDAAGRIGPRSHGPDGAGRAASGERPERPPPSGWPVEALSRRFLLSDDAEEVRRLAFAVLHGRSVADRTAADWFDLDRRTVRRLREAVAAEGPESRDGSHRRGRDGERP